MLCRPLAVVGFWGEGRASRLGEQWKESKRCLPSMVPWVREGFRGLPRQQRTGRERFVGVSRVESGVVLFSPLITVPERPRQGRF